MVTTEHVDRVRTEGWTVIEDVIPKDQTESYRTEFARIARERNVGSPLSGVTFIPSVINDFPKMTDLLASPMVMEVVESLLGRNASVSFTSAIINEPGNQRGLWHAVWPFNVRTAGHIESERRTAGHFVQGDRPLVRSIGVAGDPGRVTLK